MWYHTFPQTYPTIYPSIALADSGYAYNATGTNNGGNGWWINVDIIKTDLQGWTTCMPQIPPYTVSAVRPLIPFNLLAVSENYAVGTPDLASQLVSVSDTTFCVSAMGVNDPQASSSDLVIYPNPTNGNAWLQLPQEVQKYKVTLYDELGQVVDIPLQTNGFTVELPTAALATGVYIVCATGEDGVSVYARLVKTE